MDTSIFELLLETGKAINSEIELEALVQRITDIGTELTKAQFGAFFYNVINESGEKYVLYTISGVSREAFSKFPMPRNTAIFHPTFAGLGTIRYDDVTAQPHFGKSAPYHGMPKGHLPVRSYLATSVISPVTKEVIGGLFFGHPECGIFTERSERLIEGIAAQAAIAMGNAQLFEEKKQAEKRMAEQREQYKSIFSGTTDAMLIFDDSGAVTDANPAAIQLLEYSYEELIGMKGHEILKNEGGQFEAIQEIVRSGRQYKARTFLYRKSGETVAVEVIGSHFVYRDKKQVLLVVRDITRDQQTEEALKRIEA
ncbi:MAG TPA: PAS domain S-box protein, partial [Flavisolibacter sp.]|nr:PAS domain S-box protein [Flavisolibacter sp.]